MAIDYSSHPSELVGSGEVGKKIDVKQLRDAIPDHCFEPSYSTSLYYLVRDLTYCFGAMYLAYNFIPMIPNAYARFAAWALYGAFNGMVFTGLWVIGHECGHGAFSKSSALNNTLGLILHCSFMTPYFAWRSTHRRHHIYANNMVKDHNYVPPRREEYAASLFWGKVGVDPERLEELAEDAPIFTIGRLFLQQLVGFPYYLICNITAAPTSLPNGKKASESWFGNSHLAPSGVLFRPEEFGVMLLSDVTMAAVAAGLFYCGTQIGHANMCLLYLQPYLWLNHWIVAITYLHHTHPDLPKYDNESWAFIKGATATVDRHLGPFGTHLMHNILDFHVIHHLFSRIPFYHAPEATYAVMPILGDAYHSDKESPFIPALYESFTKCQWVETANPDAPKNEQYMMYKAGPSPPPEYAMNMKGWSHGFSSFMSNLAKRDFAPKHKKTA